MENTEKKTTTFSVVVPVYNEEEVLQCCYERLTRVMGETGEGYELVFVNDGSADGSLTMLKKIAEADRRVKVLSFSRNFGHQAAVTCGMEYAAGEAVLIIDCDLQDPPEVMPDMIAKWREGYDIVSGKRKRRRGEGLFKKFSAYCYYRVMNAYSDYPMQLDTGDFRLLDRKAVNAINAMPEHNRFLRGMNAWAGFRQASVEYEREPRLAGKSKYTMKKMLKLASDGIVSNSKKPLKTPLKAGVFFTALSVIALAVFAVFAILAACKVTAFSFDPVYWLMAVVGFFGGVLLLSNGVTNAYVGRIYDEVKNRPKYIVSDKININGKE